jgi:hypothetical protein
VRVTSYLETQTTINSYAPVAHFQSNVVVPGLDGTVIAAITAAATDAPSNIRVFMVPLYGAVTRVPLRDAAFPLRQPGYELDIMGRWTSPAEKERAVEWVKALRDKLRRLAHGAYSNQRGETSDSLVRATYGPN